MTDDTVSKISFRYHVITRRLNLDFWNSSSDTEHSFYVGSYGRDTEIFASDIDMLFCLPSQVYARYNMYQSNGQSALLQAVKNSLRRTYSLTELKGDGQIIKVSFSDDINFEVLPAFINSDGRTYTYADSNNYGSWKVTDPKSEIAAISNRNMLCNWNLKRLCKMMRAWKDNMDVPIKGILIDTLAYQFIDNWKWKDKSYLYYDWICRDFFKFCEEQNPDQEWWRAPGSGRFVYNSENFRYKAKRAYNISLEAIEVEEYEYIAKSKWRQIFGPKFPY